ncbi:MAG: glycosyltransferase, partial [Chitinivibrionales bacterium]|nr:glycosyltransferase [Chitinivibrionales bacterium]
MARRILLINWRDTRNPEAGGAETYYHEIYRRLAADGWRVDLLAHAFEGAPAEELVDGIRVIRRGSRALFNYEAVPFVREHQHEYDLIVEDLNKLPFFTPLYVSRPRLHMVMHFFGPAIFHETIFPFAAYVYSMERLISLTYRGERFVAISKSTHDEVAERVKRHAGIDIVEPGIDTAFFQPSVPKSKTPLLVCVSRLRKYKNVQFLIEAMPQLRSEIPDLTLTIAGGGEYRKPLESLASRLGVDDAVVFAGRVSEEEKRDLLSRATLFVNSSAKEGWGITTIEAAMCGTASVASDVAGLRDSVRDNDTGLLFPYNDRDAYVKATLTLLRDVSRRREMEKRARIHAEALGWDRIA